MRNETEKTLVAILKMLQEAQRPVGASQIALGLPSMGLDLSPRTVRLYLAELDRRGLTRLVSRRRGRTLTERGREELAKGNVIEKVGIVSSRIDSLAYRMTYRLGNPAGSVITNICLISSADLILAINETKPVFLSSLAMSSRVFIAGAGESIGSMKVPADSVALGTVCSITLNGILLHEGIPVVSRFGGLLEMRDWKPMRFIELIEYRGSTLDPFEVFIRADMTRVRSVAAGGSGIVCASFREIPAVAANDVAAISKRMSRHGLGGILAVGRPNQPLFDIPVSDGHCGMVVMGGLNPMAAISEAGIKVRIRSLAELKDYSLFREMSQLPLRSHHRAYQSAAAARLSEE